MSLLFESIRAENARAEALSFHQERMMRSREALWALTDPLDLAAALAPFLLSMPAGVHKLRVFYDKEIRKVELAAYKAPLLRSVLLVDGGNFSYKHKSADRSLLEAFHARAVSQGADTALLTSKGFLRDILYANVAFFDGQDWYTPTQPLLLGTRRARLLAAGRLKQRELKGEDLASFQCMSPLNAFLDLGDLSVPCGKILRTEA